MPRRSGGGLWVWEMEERGLTVDDGHEERLWIVDLEAGPRALGRGYARLRSPAWAADGQSVVVEASSAGFSDLVQVSVVE